MIRSSIVVGQFSRASPRQIPLPVAKSILLLDALILSLYPFLSSILVLFQEGASPIETEVWSDGLDEWVVRECLQGALVPLDVGATQTANLVLLQA